MRVVIYNTVIKRLCKLQIFCLVGFSTSIVKSKTHRGKIHPKQHFFKSAIIITLKNESGIFIGSRGEMRQQYVLGIYYFLPEDKVLRASMHSETLCSAPFL